MNNENSPSRGNLPDWVPAKEFVDLESMIAVRVSSRTLPTTYTGQVPTVHYSFEIGRIQNERVQRHFQAQCLVEHGKAYAVPFPTEVLAKLIHDMEQWVQTERQEREDKVMEARIAKERKMADFGKQEPRGLKTLSKRDGQSRG